MSQPARTSFDDDLWATRVDDMALKLEGSHVAPIIDQLYAELAALGIEFKPPCYVSNEWGCIDGHPWIGIPFYLVDARLHGHEEEFADDLEDPARILAGLRHEAGHAITYAYRLYEDPEWQALFGNFFSDYRDDYSPVPYSRRHVRHLPGWYAQKHPDEDFAETFAVWMTPGLDWRARYQAWPDALAKLEYVDRAMKRIGNLPPVHPPDEAAKDPDELAFTVAEFYDHRDWEDRAPVDTIGAALDEDLREVFGAEGPGTDAYTLIRDHRKKIMRAVSSQSGARMYLVKTILDFVAARARSLGLRAAPHGEVEALIGITAVVATLTHTYLREKQLVAA